MFYAPLTDELRPDSDRDFVVPLSEPAAVGPNHSIIPGTTLQWCYDSTSLALLRGCLRKYHFGLVQGWRWRETPPPLTWGTYFHTCMETYHKCIAYGLSPETSTKRVVRLAMLLGERLLSLDNTRTKETLVRSVVWYLDEYKDDPLKTALLPDGHPAVELSFMLPIFDIKVGPTDDLPSLDICEVENWYKETTGQQPYLTTVLHSLREGRKLFGKLLYHGQEPQTCDFKELLSAFYTITIHFAGHIDRVAHFHDEVFVTDFKSSKYALTSEWVRGFDMSTQFEGYYTAASIMASLPNTVFPGLPAGVLVDGVQLGVNFTRFARFPLHYHPSTANEFLDNFKALVLTKAEPAARLGLYPREAESECNAYRRRDGTGGCEYRPVCLAPPAARERELQQGFAKRTWDPSQSR